MPVPAFAFLLAKDVMPTMNVRTQKICLFSQVQKSPKKSFCQCPCPSLSRRRSLKVSDNFIFKGLKKWRREKKEKPFELYCQITIVQQVDFLCLLEHFKKPFLPKAICILLSLEHSNIYFDSNEIFFSFHLQHSPTGRYTSAEV